MDGLDSLGAATLAGMDWLDVLKGAAGKITGSADDKARAKEKAEAEKKAAEKSRTHLFVGAGVVAGIAALWLLLRGS